MFRNVFGSIGISMGTAMVQQSTQARSSYLSAWMTPLYPPFTALRDEYERTLMSLGRVAGMAQQQATGEIYQVFHQQSEVLAYHDVYLIFAVGRFLRGSVRLVAAIANRWGPLRRMADAGGSSALSGGRKDPGITTQ